MMAYLYLHDVADEWQAEVLDELDPEAHDLPLTAEERADLEAEGAKFVELCEQLGIDATPDALRAFDEPTLIPKHEFEDYARQVAEDIGAIESDGPWPTYCIDWDRAASDLKMDYTAVEFDGITYYYRGG